RLAPARRPGPRRRACQRDHLGDRTERRRLLAAHARARPPRGKPEDRGERHRHGVDDDPERPEDPSRDRQAAGGRVMIAPTEVETATQVYQVFIKATPEQIWDAITKPEFTTRYFHGAYVDNTHDLHLVRGPEGQDWGTGPTFAFDPPRRLVHEWRSLYDDDLATEDASRVTWEIEPHEGGVCK